MSDNWHGWIGGVEFTSRASALKALGISEPAPAVQREEHKLTTHDLYIGDALALLNEYDSQFPADDEILDDDELATRNEIKLVAKHFRAYLSTRPQLSQSTTDARELDKIVSDIQSVEPGSGGCNDIDHEEARAMIERYVQSRLASAREREGALREALKIIILECCDGQCGTPDIARAALDPREEGPKDGSGKA